MSDFYLKKIIFAFLLLFSFTLQSQQYDFRVFREEQGLAQSYVYSIQQRSSGFVAIGTGGGLSITGGGGFTNYTAKEGLEENIVTSLAEDAEGTLWAGHFLGGISFIRNQKPEIFKPYTRDMKRVNTLFARDGKVWIGNSDDNLLYIQNDQLERIPLEGCGGINFFAASTAGIFTASGNGIYFIKQEKGKVVPRQISFTQGKTITALRISGDSVIYYGTDEGEIYKMSLTLPGNFPEPKLFYKLNSPVSIKSIWTDEENIVWAATMGEGLLRFDLNFSFGKSITPQIIGQKNGLEEEDLTCLFNDKENNLWIGTYGGGLYLLPNKSFLSYNRRTGLMDEDVLSVAKASGFLLSGCRSGFQICTFPGGENAVFYSEKNGFVDDEVKTLALLDSITVLIGTRNYGVFSFDLRQKQFSKLRLSSTGINHINVVSDTLVIFSTIDGLILFNPITRLEKRYSTADGLPHNMILQTAVDKNNRIWIAARQSQLTFLEKGKISIIRENKIFNSFNITSLLASPSGNLYFGTSGSGLYCYDGKSFTRRSQEQGMVSNFINGLVFDEVNNKVISTHSNGISIWNLQSDVIRRLADRNQTPAFENRTNAVFHQTGTGEILFGHAQGICLLNSGTKSSRALSPLFHFTAIVCNGKQYPLGTKKIELDAGEYDIRLEFIGISFPASDEVTYEYQMEGLSPKTRNTFSRVLEFPSLREGKYLLRIFSKTAEGAKNREASTLEILIPPPFYKKPWFILSEILALVFLLWGIFRIRIFTLKKANQRLEEKVEEKTREIEEDKKMIQLMNVELKNKNEDITSGIEYAKRIQLSLLPRARQIQSRLDSVLFYLPRDIVSGDFYWFRETENYFYLGAADCTGHGVSGAFMSIIGINLLDRFLDESSNEALPSDLLKVLNSSLNSVLKQKNADSKIKDGMDIALCRIKKDKSQMIFSAAARPLYFIRSQRMEEFSSAPYPVGGYFSEAEKKFMDSTIDLQPGDIFYLFSDGFADQFGGPSRKRYSKSRFAEFILQLSSVPIQDQKSALMKEFKSWKGNSSQQDDILVFGVRI